MEETVKETPKFSKCVIKQTTHYYKVLLKVGAILLALIVVSYCAYMAINALTPYVVAFGQALVNVPMWIYIPVAIVVIPIITAIAVCYVNRNEAEISKSDEDYTCKEE